MNEYIEEFKKDASLWQDKLDIATTDDEIRAYKILLEDSLNKVCMVEILCDMLKQGYVFDRSGHNYLYFGEKEPDESLIYEAVKDSMFTNFQFLDLKSEKNPVRVGTLQCHCANCGKGYLSLLVDKKKKRMYLQERDKKMKKVNGKIKYGKDVYKDFPCPMGKIEPYSVVIDIPSGKMLVANVLHKWYDWKKASPENEKLSHEREYCINYITGQKHYSEKMSELNCASFNVGNCSCDLFQTSKKKDSFVMGDYELQNKKGYKEVASVCTDFWGYYIVDKDDFIAKAGNEELIVVSEVGEYRLKSTGSAVQEVSCVPGRYKFTHRYHLIVGDDNSGQVFTHIKRIK